MHYILSGLLPSAITQTARIPVDDVMIHEWSGWLQRIRTHSNRGLPHLINGLERRRLGFGGLRANLKENGEHSLQLSEGELHAFGAGVDSGALGLTRVLFAPDLLARNAWECIGRVLSNSCVWQHFLMCSVERETAIIVE